MERYVLGGAKLAWLAVLLLAATVQAQSEAVSGVQMTQQQQQQQQWQRDVPEPVQPPTVHLRQPGFSPPAPAQPAGHPTTDADGTPDPLLVAARHKSPQQHMPPQHSPRGPRPRVPLSAVVTMSAFMALMSSLGVLPYFFFSKLSKPWAGLANAVASGVMLAASFGLLAEGAPYSGTYLVGGMLLGVLFVKFSQEHLEQYEVDSFEQLAGADARKVILFLAVMAVHAVGEGGGVGVSFAGDRGWAQGTLVTLAIGLHNVPEGLAVATVMAAKGTPPGRTLLWTALTALPQAIVAPIAYVFVDTFKALLPLALGFAAGCMIWIVLAELLPDALEAVEADQVATYATAAAAWLQGLSVFIAQLETPAGTLSSPFGDYEEVLPLGITPVLLKLLPTLAVPGLAAGLLAKRCWARPLVLGLTVGLLTSYSTACWMQLLLSSSQRLLCAVLLPLVGYGAAALLWGRVRRGWVAGAGAGFSAGGRSHCEESAADCTAGVKGHQGDSPQHPQQQHRQDLAAPWPPTAAAAAAAVVTPAAAASHFGYSVPHQRTSHSAAADAWEANSGLASAGATGSSWQQQQHVPSGWPHQQQQQAGLPLASSLPAAAYAAAPASSAAWETHSTSSSGSCCGNEQPQQPPAGLLKGSSRGSPLLLPGRGDCVLPITRSLGGDGKGWGSLLPGQWDSSGGSSREDGVLAGSSSSSRAVVAASLLALAGAAGSGGALGLQLAGALAAAPDHIGHVLPPMILLGVVFGAACVGLLQPLLGHRIKLLGAAASLVSSTPMLVAVLALLFQPGWVQDGAAFAAADSVQGLLLGYNLFVLLALVLPMGKRWGPRKCSVGVACGVVCGVLISGVLGLLCVASPYCLHVRPAGFLAGAVA